MAAELEELAQICAEHQEVAETVVKEALLLVEDLARSPGEDTEESEEKLFKDTSLMS